MGTAKFKRNVLSPHLSLLSTPYFAPWVYNVKNSAMSNDLHTANINDIQPEAIQGLLSLGEARPYRSHKIPACDRCRKRKLRCDVDIPSQPCRLCRSHQTDCSRVGSATAFQNRKSVGLGCGTVGGQSSKRLRIEPLAESCSQTDHNNFQSSGVPIIQQQLATHNHEYGEQPTAAIASRSSMIVGPVIAEDVQLLEMYMSSQKHPNPKPRGRLYDCVSDNPQDPVVYLSVSRRREGLSSSDRPGEKQKEILEQILGPHVEDVINLYVFCH